MKIVVFGDSHGETRKIENYLRKEKVDLLIHTGDYMDDGIKIATKYKLPIQAVRGNCDRNQSSDFEKVFQIENTKFFLTHGDKYNVKYSYQNVYYKGLEVNANIIIFGHTHLPLLEKTDDAIIINPGSISLPRGAYSSSVAVIELSEGNIAAGIVYM